MRWSGISFGWFFTLALLLVQAFLFESRFLAEYPLLAVAIAAGAATCLTTLLHLGGARAEARAQAKLHDDERRREHRAWVKSMERGEE